MTAAIILAVVLTGMELVKFENRLDDLDWRLGRMADDIYKNEEEEEEEVDWTGDPCSPAPDLSGERSEHGTLGEPEGQ